MKSLAKKKEGGNKKTLQNLIKKRQLGREYWIGGRNLRAKMQHTGKRKSNAAKVCKRMNFLLSVT